MMPDAILAPASRGNYGSRQNHAPEIVVIHCTEGSFHGTLVWFSDPKAKASAHYVVARSGVCAQCVPEGDAAWHAGSSDVNHRSIGVELEGYVDDPRSFPSDSVLLYAAAGVVANVCHRHGIPLDRAHIIGHDEVPDPANPTLKGGAHRHRDPGPTFPWPEFMRLVQQRSAAEVA